ncbi:MAG: hypothetical protein Q6363_001650 [Candidatus Njordarchaeota archaeon]
MNIKVKIDIEGKYLVKIKNFWKSNKYKGTVILDTGWFIAKIEPFCLELKIAEYKYIGCQGGVEVRLKHTKTTIRADLKGGAIIWRVGHLLTKNDIIEFLQIFRLVLRITDILMPIIDMLPTEHPPHLRTFRRWRIQLALVNDWFEYPDFIKKNIKSSQDGFIEIPRI